MEQTNSQDPETDVVMDNKKTVHTQKEIAQMLKQQKDIRNNNAQVLKDREDALRYSEIGTLSAELNLRAMIAFIESEKLLPEYQAAVDARDKRINTELDKSKPVSSIISG